MTGESGSASLSTFGCSSAATTSGCGAGAASGSGGRRARRGARRARVGGPGRQVALGFRDRRRSGVGDLHASAAADSAAAPAATAPPMTASWPPLSSASSSPPPRAPNSQANRPPPLAVWICAAARLDLGLRQIVARHRLAVGRDEHRLAVREEPRQRVAAHARPVAHRAAVDVHPGRDAGRIEADAALLHPHRDVADARRCRRRGNARRSPCPAMCCECSATWRERRRSIALVCGER